jgi:hypothetical protein
MNPSQVCSAHDDGPHRQIGNEMGSAALTPRLYRAYGAMTVILAHLNVE